MLLNPEVTLWPVPGSNIVTSLGKLNYVLSTEMKLWPVQESKIMIYLSPEIILWPVPGSKIVTSPKN